MNRCDPSQTDKVPILSALKYLTTSPAHILTIWWGGSPGAEHQTHPAMVVGQVNSDSHLRELAPHRGEAERGEGRMEGVDTGREKRERRSRHSGTVMTMRAL